MSTCKIKVRVSAILDHNSQPSPNSFPASLQVPPHAGKIPQYFSLADRMLELAPKPLTPFSEFIFEAPPHSETPR